MNSLEKKSRPKSKRIPRSLDLWNVMKALEAEDNAVLIAFFNQGYTPEKAPTFMSLIVDTDKLNEKYALWQAGKL